MEQTEILVKSTVDGSMEPSVLFRSENKNRPLLVGLHTWSYDRFNQIKPMQPLAEQHDFNLLLPEFRGANLPENPRCTEACASYLAMQDIMDATEKVIELCEADRNNVFLLGGSGGGHMAMMMAGYKPDFFKAVASFCGITDLKKWKTENARYADCIDACCSKDEAEMLKRSPINYIDNIAKANIKIFHGKHDKSVPVTQSIELYNRICEKYPKSTVYLDIFDGGHMLDRELAMLWILSQYRKDKSEELTS